MLDGVEPFVRAEPVKSPLRGKPKLTLRPRHDDDRCGDVRGYSLQRVP